MSEHASVGDELDRPANPLADVGDRLLWANSDGETFSAVSKWFQDAGAYAVRVQHQGNRWEAVWQRLIEPRVEAEKFSELARLLGSFLDHTRAALNYATYQLALRALRDNPTLQGKLIPESVEFPIFNDPSLFKRQNRIKKLPQEHRDAIESIQPYDGKHQGLWVLHELAREYRHRVVHPTALLPSPEVFRVFVDGRPVKPADLEVVPVERLKHDTVVMRFSLPLGHNTPDAHVHPQIAVAVAIDHVLVRRMIGTSVLNQIRTDTEAALDVIEPILTA